MKLVLGYVAQVDNPSGAILDGYAPFIALNLALKKSFEGQI